MIRDWFRTTKAIAAGLDVLRTRLTDLVELLEEAREECVDVASERDGALERLAQAERERDEAWRLLAGEETRPIPALTPGHRAEIARERARADALESRLAVLQRANMRLDVPA